MTDMFFTKLYLLAKKIHRILFWLMLFFIFMMASTGSLMKFNAFTTKYLGFLDLGMVRFLHNSLSPYFTGVLGLMALTGLVMYFFPMMRKEREEKDTQDSRRA